MEKRLPQMLHLKGRSPVTRKNKQSLKVVFRLGHAEGHPSRASSLTAGGALPWH